MRIAFAVARRLGSALLVVWLTATVVFFALRATGDPLEAVLGGPGSQAGPEAVAQAEQQYGLDQPIFIQYLAQLWRIVTLDFGTSYARKLPVSELLMANVPPTMLISTLALLLAWALVLVGVLLVARTTFVTGSIARENASRRRSWLPAAGRAARATLSALETVSSVMPQFLLGAVLIVIFASTLGWVPVTSQGFSGMILPIITLAVPIAGFLAHVMRGPLDEAAAAPFATTARARGVSETRLTIRHTLRHAALPGLALSGWAYGSLLSGAVVVESLFARQGLGRLLLDAATSRDIPVVIGAVTVIAICYVAIMIVSDLLESIIDPRLRDARGNEQNSVLAAGVGS